MRFLYLSAVPNQMDLGILTGGCTSQNKGLVFDLGAATPNAPGFIPIIPVGLSRAGGPPILGGPTIIYYYYSFSLLLSKLLFSYINS